MGYKITEQAKQSPIAVPSPISGEYLGIGGIYYKNVFATCGTCNAVEQAEWEKQQAALPRPFYREAEPHEYEALVEQYKASGGIPEYLILIPDQANQKAHTEDKK